MPPSPSPRVQSIQSLRGLGAILVVIHHATTVSATPGAFIVGAAGVDIFFVISGIVMVLATRSNATPGDFMFRRMARIVPLYWLFTAAAIGNLYWVHDHLPGWRHVVSSLFFLPAAGQPPLLYPGWSINFEVFFYLVLAASLWTRRRNFGIAAACLAVLATSTRHTGVGAIDYYLNPHLLEFVAGLVVGYAVKAGLAPARSFGVAALVGAALLFCLNSGPPNVNIFVYWGVPSILLIVGAMAFEQSRFVNARPVLALGDASYSIYLAHPLVIWGLEASPAPKGLSLAVLAVVTSIITGLLVHRSIERPLLRWTLLLSPKVRQQEMLVAETRAAS